MSLLVGKFVSSENLCNLCLGKKEDWLLLVFQRSFRKVLTLTLGKYASLDTYISEDIC